MANLSERWPMATSKELFAQARVRGMHVRAVEGTVVGEVVTLTDGCKTVCKCGCGGYWEVRWDTLEAPNDVIAFLPHDLELLDVVDQLASRSED